MISTGTPGIGTVPTISALSHSAAPPPGEARISSASPCSTNSIASVTTMSGTRVMTMRKPLNAPRQKPSPSTSGMTTNANSSLAPLISTAAVTLVTAIIEAIERSMPPAITTIACAATAKT